MALATAGPPMELEMLVAAVGSSAATRAQAMQLSTLAVLRFGMYAGASVLPRSRVTVSALAAVGPGVEGVSLLSAFASCTPQCPAMKKSVVLQRRAQWTISPWTECPSAVLLLPL